MILTLKTWLADRRKQRLQRAYNDGYDYAAGSLLRGDTTPLEFQAKCVNNIFNTGGTDSAFDSGAMAAVDKLCRLNAVIDDRVRI